MCDLHICRICLNSGVRGYKLEEHSLRSFYEQIMRQKSNPRDSLPQWVCFECGTLLHKFHKFKQKCLHGQVILRQIACNRMITYESVAIINRYSENLISSIRIVQANKHVHTINAKHKPVIKETSKQEMNIIKPHEIILPLPEENNEINNATVISNKITKVDSENTIFDTKNTTDDIIFDNDHSMSSEDDKMFDTKVIKHDIVLEDEIITTTFNSSEPIKSESLENADKQTNKQINTIFDTTNLQNTNHDTNEARTNFENTYADFNFDISDDIKSSDDEPLLDIAKKTSKLKRKSTSCSEKDKEKTSIKTKKSKVGQKFTRPSKQVLNPQFWKKISMTEAEALKQFKQREFNNDYYLKAKFKCHSCFKGFSKDEMLVRHLKLRHGDSCGNMECRFCRMRFKLKHQLEKHIKEHFVVYNCLLCKLQCTRLNSAITHQELHAGIKKTCKHCGKEFNHLSTYYTHVRMSHRSAHVCVACGASFVSEAGLLQHTKVKHFDKAKELEEEILKRREPTKKPETSNENVPKEPITQSGDDTEEIYCAKCDIKFMSRRAYNLHFFKSDNHDDGDAFAAVNKDGTNHRTRPKIPTSCQHCDKDFPSRQAYKKHHQAEHSHIPLYIPDERDICEICGASIQAKSIQYHMKVHTGEREFLCPAPHCGVRFTLKANMQRHYNIKHLGIVYPKYIRKRPGRRKKKSEVIHEHDFTPLVKTRTGYFL